MKKSGKKVFEVEENETISDCLDRIDKAGYMPVRRTEKPIFKEVGAGKSMDYQLAGRQIIFEARLKIE